MADRRTSCYKNSEGMPEAGYPDLPGSRKKADALHTVFARRKASPVAKLATQGTSRVPCPCRAVRGRFRPCKQQTLASIAGMFVN